MRTEVIEQLTPFLRLFCKFYFSFGFAISTKHTYNGYSKYVIMLKNGLFEFTLTSICWNQELFSNNLLNISMTELLGVSFVNAIKFFLIDDSKKLNLSSIFVFDLDA